MVSTLLTQTLRYRTNRLKITLMTANQHPKYISAVGKKLMNLFEGFILHTRYPKDTPSFRSNVLAKKHLKVYTKGMEV